MTDQEIKTRLEELRVEIRAEQISYGEIAELENLAEHIDPSDVELLEWAGVPEFPDDEAGAMSERVTLVVEYDVTDLSEEERDGLLLEAAAQGEPSDSHPAVEVHISISNG